MSVTIFEYASGGGFQGRSIPQNILCEGYSMLKTATEDFQAAGFKVTTLLDSRLKSLQTHLKADEVLEVSTTHPIQRALDTTLKSSDMSLIIAPETGGLLSSLVQTAGSSATSLNATPASIDMVSDKAKLTAALHQNGLPAPETKRLSIEDVVEEAAEVAKEFSGSIVVKPLDGVGCEDLSVINNSNQFKMAATKILKDGRTKHVIIQKFIEGLPASVTLISNGWEAQPVSLNLQQVSLNTPPEPSCYLGGVVPLLHSAQGEAFDTAKKAVELFRGLKGYIGVDMILSPSGPVILEINPRLTVSYVGLKRVSKMNLAGTMVKAAQGEELPSFFELEGVSVFSKIRSNTVDNIKGRVEILYPPLQIDGEDTPYTFIAAKGQTESEARMILSDASRLYRIAGKVS